MNCFQLIKTVLDEAYDAIEGDEAAKDAAVKAQLTYLSATYVKLREEGCLDYTDPARRFAYLFTYTTCHANLVYERIQSSAALRAALEAPAITVSCIGGGPGSDFLGILKYCQRSGLTPAVTCHLLDRDPAWGESWSDVGSKLNGAIQITTHFNPFDVTKPAKWTVFKKHFQADLFTLIYFMSEVYALRDDAASYFDALFTHMKHGALLLFVDNNSAEFYGWFDELVAKHGLRVIEANRGSLQLPYHEEKKDLEPYMTRLGRSPRIKADAAWRVVQKV